MKSDARSPAPAQMIMALGSDPQPATALARACGLPLLHYDLAELTEALGQGRLCIVVWPDPHSTVLDALRKRTAPSAEAAAWRQDSHDLLTLFALHRRRLLLVAARLITEGQPDDLRRLAGRVALTAPVLPPAPDLPDLPGLLARFIGAHLSDLRSVWQELQAVSLSPPEETHRAADLDPLAQILAADQTAAERGLGQAAQQRAAMASLLANLNEATQGLTDARARIAAEDLRSTRLEQDLHAERAAHDRARTELDLVRAQLGDLTAQLAAAEQGSDAAAAHQTHLDRLELILQAEREAQDQLQTELDLVRAQLVDLSAQMAAEPDMTSEVALLRAQLISVTDLFQQASAQPATLGPAHIVIESAFATLLSDLAVERDLRRTAESHRITTAEDLQDKSRRRQSVPNRSGNRGPTA